MSQRIDQFLFLNIVRQSYEADRAWRQWITQYRAQSEIEKATYKKFYYSNSPKDPEYVFNKWYELYGNNWEKWQAIVDREQRYPTLEYSLSKWMPLLPTLPTSSPRWLTLSRNRHSPLWTVCAARSSRLLMLRMTLTLIWTSLSTTLSRRLWKRAHSSLPNLNHQGSRNQVEGSRWRTQDRVQGEGRTRQGTLRKGARVVRAQGRITKPQGKEDE